MERGAAPAGFGLISRALGTPRVTVRLHYGRLPLAGLDGGGRRAAKAARIRRPVWARPHPEARSRGEKSPRWSAERRRALARARLAKARKSRGEDCWCASRRSIPLAFCGGRRPAPPCAVVTRRRARAANNRAGGALAFSAVMPRKSGASSNPRRRLLIARLRGR